MLFMECVWNGMKWCYICMWFKRTKRERNVRELIRWTKEIWLRGRFNKCSLCDINCLKLSVASTLSLHLLKQIWVPPIFHFFKI